MKGRSAHLVWVWLGVGVAGYGCGWVWLGLGVAGAECGCGWVRVCVSACVGSVRV